MSIERKCENCANNETSSCDNCYNFFYFAPIEELVRQDEINKILETISKVCTRENAKFCFQLDGKDYQVTQVGTVDSMEQVFKQEERNKIIKLLKSDLENFDGLADECVERKDIHELLENNAVRKYIEETIKLLETEQ